MPMYAENESIQILGNVGNLSRAGYEFAGWALSTAANATVKNPGDSLIMPSQDTFVYASWVPNTYQVDFNSEGGSAVASSSFRTDELLSEPTILPTKSGHSFTGWARSRDGQKITFPYLTGATSNIELFALWSRNAEPISQTKQTETNVGAPESRIAAAPAPAQPTSKVKQRTPGASLARQIGMTVTPKAKIKLKVAKASKKICRVSGSRLVALKRGSCSVTVTVTPKKTKKIKKPKAIKRSTVVAIS
jgi:uncharacterized repeat protein (TIGR02543 family)